jgi:hypothetical protein
MYVYIKIVHENEEVLSDSGIRANDFVFIRE